MANSLFDGQSLGKILADLPLGGLRFFESTGSTNDDAALWSAAGAQDFSLVVADEQTAGRGRLKRIWFTPPGGALAFSLILKPRLEVDLPHITLFVGLGALAVSDALRGLYALDAAIKWPNDVLLDGRKVCGILVEAQWLGEQIPSVILGIGVNVSTASAPPDDQVVYPSASVEGVLGRQVNRGELLHEILRRLVVRRAQMGSPSFVQDWETRLAFRGESVRLVDASTGSVLREGVVLGLTGTGELRLQTGQGEQVLAAGEMHLKPAGSNQDV
jgi:BirA family biotin operon repressor/biotin-[acetyl-CoA-carboxylase] ligase